MLTEQAIVRKVTYPLISIGNPTAFAISDAGKATGERGVREIQIRGTKKRAATA